MENKELKVPLVYKLGIFVLIPFLTSFIIYIILLYRSTSYNIPNTFPEAWIAKGREREGVEKEAEQNNTQMSI